MPPNIGADALAGCSRISKEEVGSSVAGERSAKQDGAVLAAVATVESIDVIPPHLEPELDNMLAMGHLTSPSSNWMTVSAKFWATTALPTLVIVPMPGAGASAAAESQ